MAVMVGGLMIIWLGLAMGAAALRGLDVTLHYPARLAAPPVLALAQTGLFLLFVPGTPLLSESWHWPMAGGLIAAAWLINGAVSVLYWYRNRPLKDEPAT